MKYVRNFGKIIKQSYVNGWIEKDPFLNYKGKVKENERTFLTKAKIQTMLKKSLKLNN